MKIEKKCPMCGISSGLELNKEEADRYKEYLCGEGHIQTQLPELNAFEREFLITGYCPKCQHLLFGAKLPDDMSKWEGGEGDA